jgi:hypothetical protein
MPAKDEKRECAGCGCTEDRACTITVAIAAADGTKHVVIKRGCSWSELNPKICTACEAIYSDNQTETDVLMDLFPAEFDPGTGKSPRKARQRSAV